MKAFLKNYRQSPRKVRLVARAVKGQPVSSAILNLSVIGKRAALPLKKLVDSAVANAKSQGFDSSNLIIEKMEVNQGIVMKRSMPRARGSAYPIRKKTSCVSITLKAKSQKLTAKS